MKISISQITTLKADLESDLAAFAKAGWTAVELSIEKVDQYLKLHSLGELGQLLDQQNLEPIAAIGLAPTGPGLLTAQGSLFDAYLDSLERQLLICKELNIPVLGIGADPAREANGEAWQERAIANVRIAAERAQANGVRIGMEALSLNPPIGPFLLESLNETRSFVEAVDHPAIGINFDIFHFIRSGGTIDDIQKVRLGQVLNVHVCDLPEMPREQWEDKHRVMPGEGSLALLEMRDALIDRGYDGYWTLELLNEDYWEQDPQEIAVIGRKAMDVFCRETV